MATDQVVAQLTSIDASLGSVNLEKLLRKSLGDESLEKQFPPRMEEIRRLRGFATRYAQRVHNSVVEQARQSFERLAGQMSSQAGRNSSEFISQRESFLTAVDNILEEARVWQPAFVAAAIMERGFLEDEGIRQEYQRAVEQLRNETSNTLKTVEEKATAAVQGAQKLADEIETRARRTAVKVSVKDAQEQFGAASKDLAKRIKLWSWLAALSLVLLVAGPLAMLAWPLPESQHWSVGFYHALLRVLMLSGFAAFAAFCVRLLRAHLHLAEKNKHRVRVANSIEGFVNSAVEPQQRDLVLAKLVEAIVDLGDTGMIRHERDEVASPAVTGELLARILGALSPKK